MHAQLFKDDLTTEKKNENSTYPKHAKLYFTGRHHLVIVYKIEKIKTTKQKYVKKQER